MQSLILPPFFSTKRIAEVKGLLLCYINLRSKFSLSCFFNSCYLLLVIGLTLIGTLSFKCASLTSFIL